MKVLVEFGLVWVLGLAAVASAAAVRGSRGDNVSLCHPFDTCAGSDELPPKHDVIHGVTMTSNRSCACDAACALYGDCCRDAEAYDAQEQARNKDHFACVALKEFGGVYMRSRCATDWDDGDLGEIASLCALGDPSTNSRRQDPLLDMPVTSLVSMLTYTNVYCALCSREDPTLLLRWTSRLECSTLASDARHLGNTTQDFVRRNFVYNEVKASWGLEVYTEGATPVFHSCHVDPVMPEAVAPLARPCVDAVSSCASDHPGGDVAELCASYTAVMYRRNKPYRNVHCAECNGGEGVLYCIEVGGRDGIKPVFNPNAFAVLLDFGDPNGGNIVGSFCGRAQIWDPFFKRCRSAFCRDPRQEYVGGRCVTIWGPRSATEPPAPTKSVLTGTTTVSPSPSAAGTTTKTFSITSTPTNSSRMIFPDDPIPSSSTTSEGPQVMSSSTAVTHTEAPHPSESTTEPQTTKVIQSTSHLSDCTRVHLLEDELERGKNGSVFVSKYQKTFGRDQYEPYPYEGGGVLVCASNLPEGGKFSYTMAWVTLACLGASCVCLVLHLIAFALTPSPKNLSEKNLASLCLALLAAYVTFFAGQWAAPGSTVCFVVAVFMYFFFLASFCWMNVLAFDTRRMLRTTIKELRVSTGRQWRKFAAYSLYGWLLPGAALLAVVLVDLERPGGIHWTYLPMMGEFRCWFGQRKALLMFFAAPLALIMVANLFFFVSSVRIIEASKSSRSQVTSVTSTTAPPEKEMLIQFKLHVRLALMMGLTWISGIVAGYLNLSPIWYIFVVLNCLQGLFIFLFFTRKERIFPKGLLEATKRISSQYLRSRIS